MRAIQVMNGEAFGCCIYFSKTISPACVGEELELDITREGENVAKIFSGMRLVVVKFVEAISNGGGGLINHQAGANRM